MSIVTPIRQPKRVKAKFIGPFAVALLSIMVVFAFAIYTIETRVRDQDLQERARAVAKLFAIKLAKDGNMMRAVVRAMMGNQAIEEAFRRGDRAGLERQARGLFESLRSDHRITHLYFTGANRINLYRLHSPPDHGDEINRATMLQAHSRKQAVHGLELGPLGTLTLRMVMPWPYREPYLGYVEIGEEVEHLIDEVHDALAVDLLVLVDKRYLSPAQWQQGQAMMKRQGDWQRFTSHVALAQTGVQLPAAFDEQALARLLAGKTVELAERGHPLHMAVVPLEDAGGHHIGELVIMRDIAGLKDTFDRYILVVSLLSLAVAGGVLAVFYVALDRVERDYQHQHELEHQLLRMNTEHQRILQLEKLSALGTMIGGIAHQLNNPLVGVVNMAQLAEREIEQHGDPARTRDLLAEIRNAGADCRAFVQRMLEFSKVSCFESKSTPIAALIEDTVLMFRQTEARHLPVEIRLPDQPPELAIDPILVRHALFNLLQNAAQATAGNKAITIRLAESADPATGAPGWLLSVADQGCGIAPEVLDRIFEPFFTTRSGGIGLGLPVVQQVALLHDGYVTATNRPEHGAEFALWLPS